MKKTVLLAVSSVIALAGCATGHVDVLGAFEIRNECRYDIRFSVLQNGSVVASNDLSNDTGRDFNDSNVNYRQPMQLHFKVLSSNGPCPAQFNTANEYFWPAQDQVAMLTPMQAGRYRMDLKAFQVLVQPGGLSKPWF